MADVGLFKSLIRFSKENSLEHEPVIDVVVRYKFKTFNTISGIKPGDVRNYKELINYIKDKMLNIQKIDYGKLHKD